MWIICATTSQESWGVSFNRSRYKVIFWEPFPDSVSPLAHSGRWQLTCHKMQPRLHTVIVFRAHIRGRTIYWSHLPWGQSPRRSLVERGDCICPPTKSTLRKPAAAPYFSVILVDGNCLIKRSDCFCIITMVKKIHTLIEKLLSVVFYEW